MQAARIFYAGVPSSYRSFQHAFQPLLRRTYSPLLPCVDQSGSLAHTVSFVRFLYRAWRLVSFCQPLHGHAPPIRLYTLGPDCQATHDCDLCSFATVQSINSLSDYYSRQNIVSPQNRYYHPLSACQTIERRKQIPISSFALALQSFSVACATCLIVYQRFLSDPGPMLQHRIGEAGCSGKYSWVLSPSCPSPQCYQNYSLQREVPCGRHKPVYQRDGGYSFCVQPSPTAWQTSQASG
jgi:hypothetical protein